MLYSKKKKLDRRNSILVAVRKELKANNAFVPPEALKALSEALDTSVYYEIEVVRDPDDAVEEVSTFEVDDDTERSSRYGITIYGDVKYADGTETEDEAETMAEAEFDINQPFVVIMNDVVYWLQSRSSDLPNKHRIVVYAPESIIDEAQYTAQKNAELDELCKLR